MTYLISDIHGYPFEKFEALFEKAGFCDNDICYVLGDVIDRGPDGIKLLLYIMGKSNFEFIIGNHEDMMLQCAFLFEGDDAFKVELNFAQQVSVAHWMRNGGEPTMNALNACPHAQIKRIFDFLEDAPAYKQITVNGKEYILVHGGLGGFSPDKDISQYGRRDLIWSRPSLEDRYYEDKTTVFGHTPTLYYGSKYEGKPIYTDTWINIDAGAACGKDPVLLRLDDMKEFYVDNCD